MSLEGRCPEEPWYLWLTSCEGKMSCNGLNQGKFESEIHLVMSCSLRSHELYSPWNSPGQNIGEGSLSLLQGIFPIQGMNLGLPHCRQILYQLSHKGSSGILEWVAYPFPSGSSWLRNQTEVSCIAGGFFTNWAITLSFKLFLGFSLCVMSTFGLTLKIEL